MGILASFSTRKGASTQQVAINCGLNKRGQMLAAGERAESDALGWAKQQGTKGRHRNTEAALNTTICNKSI